MSVCLENESFFHSQDDVGRPGVEACLQKFRLYETRSMFYMIGRDKNRMYWRVLKIDRLDPSELNVREDSTTYTESECSELLRRVHEGNKSTGGLKFVTTCYGIVGFIKFLGPYYMLLITKRREIGVICGHTVYAISKIEMVPVPNSTVRSAVANSRDEDRFKKLLCMVDLTKDFFFSYSYHIMRSLQKNLCDSRTGQVLYETMFVWNEFLTRGIRNHLQNTLWTVALVYGFFKQVLLDHRFHRFFILKFSDPSPKKLPLPIFLIKALTLFHRISFTPSSIGFCVNCLLEVTLSVAGRDLTVTLIARRSRHYAGMRYLKRGVNEEGRVANDVETEQIVFADVPEGFPTQISSVVQNRGSIPLFWSQETSRLNLKPDIILSKKDQNYEATRLHFENLVKRYGNPIIILNLIKTEEKRPRESILRSEFANAINYINKDLPEENHLKFLHWDLHKHSQSKATNALSFLSKVSAYALTLTGFFYCQISSTMRPALCIKWPSSEDVRNSCLGSANGENESDVVYLRRRHSEGNNIVNGTHFVKPPTFQRGVLRTNCIDCLDRTNAAQYAFGLVALGHQLHALGVREYPKVDFNTPMAHELMGCYERMGDTLAHQYGGSAAHNKIFSAARGQWKAATQSQEFFRTLQRYYNNAYMDAVKQDAINVFLGNLQPERSKPALQELESDQHLVGNGEMSDEDDGRSLIKRCLSDGNILRDTSAPLSATLKQENFSGSVPHNQSQGAKVLFGSAPDISNPESEITFSRYTPEIPMRQLFGDVQRESNHIYYTDYGDSSNYSNFVDLDWLSSSGNSCDEEAYERSSLLASSSVAGLSMGDVINGIGANPSTAENGSNVKGGEDALVEPSYHCMCHADVLEKCPDSFGKWVTTGETLCY